MGQALYRKYRSTSLEEVVGQPHITKTLSNALKSGKISHAYLLTGPRGVGKTSIARVLAFAVNDMPYSDQPQLDIIEIDAASNRRIDEVRDLRDKVHILPTSAKYKVYIIDEVHMLTREAFNALLKTLEEPPAHVIFILATTEAHKLPETIISRTQHFSFKPIDVPTIRDHLKTIAKAEKIKVSDAALELIAEHGGGSFRDSISLLDQIRSSADSIEEDDVRTILGIAPSQQLDAVLDCVEQGDPKALLDKLTELRDLGISAGSVSSQLGELLRQRLLSRSVVDTTLLRELVSVPASSQPERMLEIVLIDSLLRHNPTSVPAPIKAVATSALQTPAKEQSKPIDTPQSIKPIQAPKAVEPVKQPQSETKASKPTVAPEPAQAVITGESNFTADDWPAVLATIKKKHNTLYGILRMAEASYEPNTLTLLFRFAFHEKQLKDATKRALVTTIISDLFNTNVTIECQLVSKQSTPEKSEKPVPPETLDTVSNIFGGAEVLES